MEKGQKGNFNLVIATPDSETGETWREIVGLEAGVSLINGGQPELLNFKDLDALLIHLQLPDDGTNGSLPTNFACVTSSCTQGAPPWVVLSETFLRSPQKNSASGEDPDLAGEAELYRYFVEIFDAILIFNQAAGFRAVTSLGFVSSFLGPGVKARVLATAFKQAYLEYFLRLNAEVQLFPIQHHQAA